MLALIVVGGAVSVAPRFGVFEGVGAGIRVPPTDFNDGGFTICKWMFRSDRSEAAGLLSDAEVQRVRLPRHR